MHKRLYKVTGKVFHYCTLSSGLPAHIKSSLLHNHSSFLFYTSIHWYVGNETGHVNKRKLFDGSNVLSSNFSIKYIYCTYAC